MPHCRLRKLGSRAYARVCKEEGGEERKTETGKALGECDWVTLPVEVSVVIPRTPVNELCALTLGDIPSVPSLDACNI
eukprot:1359037-Amorphochlora_amoeboformis.AAC.1